MPFTFEPLAPLPDVVLVTPRVFQDARGWFMETYKRSDFERAGIHADLRQDNHSLSRGIGVVRGLHYQAAPHEQGKLVRCLAGEIFDVALDIRPASATFGRFACTTLSADDKRAIWIPPGFAHGFMTLADVCEVSYKTTNEYSAAHDRAILWNDPALGIPWPRRDALVSDKDAKAPPLREAIPREGRA